MWIPNKPSNLTPFLKQAKVLLLFLSAVLFIANFYVLSTTRNHALSYSEQQNQATWFLFQLTKEFSELNSITRFAYQNDKLKEKAQLKYDLTWSRFDLLLTNKEADTFISLPGAKKYFVDLFQHFQQLESKVNTAKDQNSSEELADELNQLYLSMIQYINTNFHVKSPLYQEQMEQARTLNDVQTALLILLILCSALTIFILHKEAKYHKQQSLTDPLTDICNRLAMFEELTERLESKQSFTLYLLDLNGFKEINDKYGHQVGDQILKTFATRLHQISPYCFRIGGDEFAMLVDDINLSEHEGMIQTIKQVIQKKITTACGIELFTAASIGFAICPEDSEDINELLLIADSNMYREKHALKRSG